MTRLALANRLNYSQNIEQMHESLQVSLQELGFKQSINALEIARRAHFGQRRDDGRPFIVHPLRMAVSAIRLPGATDTLTAIVLLHDVVEDCELDIDDLSMTPEIRIGVELLTFEGPFGEEETEAKKKYYHNLSQSRWAIICKALDRIDNLVDGNNVIPKERLAKSIRETDKMLLPEMRRAEELYPDVADALYLLRFTLENILTVMAPKYTS